MQLGRNGVPHEVSAEILFSQVIKHAQTGVSVKDVAFVIYKTDKKVLEVGSYSDYMCIEGLLSVLLAYDQLIIPNLCIFIVQAFKSELRKQAKPPSAPASPIHRHAQGATATG